MIKKLAKRDKEWRKIAFHICKNADIADEITQEMYLKCHKAMLRGKILNSWYVYRCMKSSFLDILRRNKKVKTFSELEEGVLTIIISRNNSTDRLPEYYDDLKIREEYENILIKLEDSVNDLEWYDKEILMINNGRTIDTGEDIIIKEKTTFRDLSKKTSIPVNNLFNTTKKAKKNLKDKLEKQYEQWQKRKQA